MELTGKVTGDEIRTGAQIRHTVRSWSFPMCNSGTSSLVGFARPTSSMYSPTNASSSCRVVESPAITIHVMESDGGFLLGLGCIEVRTRTGRSVLAGKSGPRWEHTGQATPGEARTWRWPMRHQLDGLAAWYRMAADRRNTLRAHADRIDSRSDHVCARVRVDARKDCTARCTCCGGR